MRDDLYIYVASHSARGDFVSWYVVARSAATKQSPHQAGKYEIASPSLRLRLRLRSARRARNDMRKYHGNRRNHLRYDPRGISQVAAEKPRLQKGDLVDQV